MSNPPEQPVETAQKGQGFLPTLYASALVIVALSFGSELLIPLVLAALLAFVMAPGVRNLERVRVPRAAAVLVMVLFAAGIIGGLGVIVGQQASSLTGNLPTYQANITAKWDRLSQDNGFFEWLARGLSTTSLKPEGEPAAEGEEHDAGGLDLEGGGFALARSLAEPLLGPLATTGLVLIFTVFILLSAEDLRDRLVRLVGRRDLHRTILAMNDAAKRLSRYFLSQLALNTGFGIFVGVCLWALGLPNPLLWGILAGTMRFVPFVGVVIALVPPVLLAVAVTPDWSLALIVLVFFLAAEITMGQVAEPLVYGHSTGLSPIAVIVATGFWALLWGPIGLLIATPLTVCLVVIGRYVEGLAFLDVMFGDAPPLEPAETFYQRALERRAASLAPLARRHIAESSSTDYYDKVALPGLALAQGDLARDALGFERLDAIHGQIEELLALLENDRSLPVPHSLPDASWRGEVSVLCLPARGQLDDLAATMAHHGLVSAGFGVSVMPNSLVGASAPAGFAFADVRLCCLSVLEQGNSVAGVRYFIKRLQALMPQAAIVVGLWHASRTSPFLASLREEGGQEHIVLSIGELLAFVRALAAREPTPTEPAIAAITAPPPSAASPA